MHALKQCLAALLVVSAVSMAVPASAHWIANRVDVEIYDRTEGRLLPIYFYGGHRYVVGKPGNEYAIRVRNASGERALAVMSVDGVNVISGDTASPAQSGYVLGPSESADISGWRKDMARTAAFSLPRCPTRMRRAQAVRTTSGSSALWYFANAYM